MIKKEDFTYDLPTELIAQQPLPQRDMSRLLVLDKGTGRVSHRSFCDLPDLLMPGDCLVVNNTRVIPARLFGVRSDSGTAVEILLLKRLNLTDWETLARPGRRVRPGQRLEFLPGRLSAQVLEVMADGNRLLRFHFTGIWEEILAEAGNCPLPPYIHEQLADPRRYQTVYAKVDGSAAAPTAGLHFTPEIIKRLNARGIEMVELTLHVGLGTFRPVRSENIANHYLHAEYFKLSQPAADKINETKARGSRIVAVGTTSCRVLESVVRQRGCLAAAEGWTDLFIMPGFQFQVVDNLITNFHLPQSTLIMLVSALAGRDNVLAAYAEAVAHRYRFFSFGDAMLIAGQNQGA